MLYSSIQEIKSFNFFPDFDWIFNPSWITSWIYLETSIKSISFKPLVVNAGEPNLIPPGESADLSPTTEFLFIDISTFSHNFSILDPVILSGFKILNVSGYYKNISTWFRWNAKFNVGLN